MRSLKNLPHLCGGVSIHLVSEGGEHVSNYLLNKFLYTIDRDPQLVERYRQDPRGTVAW